MLMSRPVLVFCMDMPVEVCVSCVIREWVYKMYSRGDREDPCLRPLRRWNALEWCWPMIIISFAFLYVLIMFSKRWPVMPIFSSVAQRRCLFTLL